MYNVLTVNIVCVYCRTINTVVVCSFKFVAKLGGKGCLVPLISIRRGRYTIDLSWWFNYY